MRQLKLHSPHPPRAKRIFSLSRDSALACAMAVPANHNQRGKFMKKLFVGNIPHSTTEAELRTLFEPHGAIEQVSIVTDRDTGRSRGFAFVEMTDSAEAEKAIAALNGKELGGRALNINEARPKTDRGGPPRGGG